MLEKKLIKPLTVTLSVALIAITTVSFANSVKDGVPLTSPSNIDKTISLEQVTKDVTFLASDKLKGRGNFSNDIKTSANFIAKRFYEVGLKSPLNTLNYQQVYNVETITPKALSATINNQQFDLNKLTMVTNQVNIEWLSTNKNEEIKRHIITEDDNMRDALQAINHQGGQHLVILHSSHEKSFKRYQSYFSRGTTKLADSSDNKDAASIVIALSDITKIDSFTIEGSATVTRTELSNVIGILPGKSKADEIVLYTAHYDHLGEKQSESGVGEIFNGADDDASGVSAVINLANHFTKKANNERTLMFATFSAEEIGGFGSRYFSKQLDASSITAMINIEMIGKPAKFGAGTVWMTGMNRSNLGEQLNKTLEKHGLTIHADPYPKQNLFYRSDNATLARLGVPAHSFSSTQLDKDQHYHQVSDDINSLDLNSMHQVIKTLAIATTPLVTGQVTPSRIDSNLVKNKGLIY